jgi:hypothetical protein
MAPTVAAKNEILCTVDYGEIFLEIPRFLCFFTTLDYGEIFLEKPPFFLSLSIIL